MPNFTFPIISQWKLLSCHSNKSAGATAMKNTTVIEANVINNSAKFTLYPLYGL